MLIILTNKLHLNIDQQSGGVYSYHIIMHFQHFSWHVHITQNNIMVTWPNVPRAFSMRRINAWKMHGFCLITMRWKPCFCMRIFKRMENAHGTFGHVVNLSMTKITTTQKLMSNFGKTVLVAHTNAHNNAISQSLKFAICSICAIPRRSKKKTTRTCKNGSFITGINVYPSRQC